MYTNILPFTADIPNYSYDSDEYRILSYQLDWFRQQLKKAIRLERIAIGQKVLEEEARRWREAHPKKYRILKAHRAHKVFWKKIA